MSRKQLLVTIHSTLVTEFYKFTTKTMSLREELQKRNLIYQCSDENVFDLYNKGGEKFYIGFDPSADSLQIGNMFAVMTAIHLMKYGNKCYFLVGGATGMIGDPSHRDSERSFLSEEQLRHNEKSIFNQLKTFLENIKKNYEIDFDYEMVDNYDFYKGMDFLTFLRDVGKYMTVNQMIAKESVKKRIEDPEKSITYAEFSYMLIQGYDFCHLFEKYGVKLQLGGSDQWGNVTTGLDLIGKKLDQKAYALTIPLVTDSSGAKYGKSAGNAVWVDKKRNSPYFVYQFFMNTEDEIVEKLLKVFSLKNIEEIQAIIDQHKQKPEDRYGQKELASWVVEVLFGKEEVAQVQKITEIFFGNGDKLELIKSMSPDEVKALALETGGCKWEGEGLLDIIVKCGLDDSKGNAKKSIAAGSIYLNETKVENITQEITGNDFVNGAFLLRKGKKTFKVATL